MSEEEFSAEAELKKYDDTATTVFYWGDSTPNRTFESLPGAAKHLKENPGNGPLAELIVHDSPDDRFSLATSSRPFLRLFRNFGRPPLARRITCDQFS
jgi:hypothetical protein